MQELLIDIPDLDELYRCYMPFLSKGGLFVPTNMRYAAGHALALRVTLPDALEDDIVTGKVVWITPQGAQSSKPPGIGISFIDDKTNLNIKIEKLLGTMLNSGNPTHTM